ncbi:beta strand repeat-containing protein, partial [Sinomicrobium soli]|uniref:beta strand repeat-containing protein n=1 Tax=Sinomicrobium sp. N-1-3-6 TaxID=2219864 RepID=UPI000DCB3620
TFDSGNGSPVTIDTNADALAFDNSSNGFTSDNVQDALEELKTQLDGTTDELVDNGNGTFTHTAVDGTVVTFDSNTTTVNVVDGVYTFLDGDNQVITSIDTNADAITYDNSSSGLTAGDVQDAIDELVNHINNGAGVELVDNGDGTVSLTADDGTVLGTVDKSSLTDNGDGTYTFDSGNGSPVTIDTNADALAFDNSSNGFTSDNVQDALEELKTQLDGTTDELVDNGNGTYTHTSVDGTVTTIDANTTSVTELDGVYTFTDAAGNTITTIDTNADALAFDNSSNGFTSDNVQDALEELKTQLDGTTDELVDNGDGTYTHTSVDGTVTTIDANTTSVTEVDGVYTFTDAAGNTITTIDTNAGASGYDNTTSGLASNNVQDAIDEIVTNINNGAGVELVDNGDGTVLLTAEDGTVLGTVDKSSLTDNGDGTYTFDSGNGSPVTIDIPASVVNQFDEIVNGGPVEVNGDTYTTVEEYLQYVVNSNETLTELSYDENTNQLNFKDEAGTTHNIQLNNTDLSYDETTQELVYVDSEGNRSTIDLDNLVNSNINTGDLLTHADERISIVDGADALLHDVRIDVNEANLRLQNIGGTLQVSQIQNGTPNQILVTNVGGNGVTWADPVAIAEGSLTSDDIEVTNGNNAIFKDVALEIKEGAITTDKLAAGAVTPEKIEAGADNTVMITNENGEVVWVQQTDMVAANETLTSATFDATTGILTYNDEDGTANTLDLGAMVPNFETLTTVSVDNAAGTLTYVDEDGTSNVLNLGDLVQAQETVTNLVYDAGTGVATYTNEEGTDQTIDLSAVVDNFETVTTVSVDNTAGTLTYVDENGATNTLDLGALVDAQETVTSATFDATTGILTYNDEDGTANTLDLGAMVPNFETLTTVSVDNAAGTLTYVDEDGTSNVLNLGDLVQAQVTADNGLTKTDGNIQLGGALTDPTTITADAANTLAIAGLQTGAGTDNVVVADPASGVLRQVKAVMPKFFYMPSVVFDVSSTGTGFTRDLHQEYTEQFGNPVVSSTGATNGIPTLTETELEYYVTYYDTNVFGNVTIDADGTLHYDIIGTSPTAASFMNIVFVVK